jgi:hypothetical protein
MAKSQKRSTRETRKPKLNDKKTKVPRYQMAEGATGLRPAPGSVGPKK